MAAAQAHPRGSKHGPSQDLVFSRRNFRTSWESATRKAFPPPAGAERGDGKPGASCFPGPSPRLYTSQVLRGDPDSQALESSGYEPPLLALRRKQVAAGNRTQRRPRLPRLWAQGSRGQPPPAAAANAPGAHAGRALGGAEPTPSSPPHRVLLLLPK